MLDALSRLVSKLLGSSVDAESPDTAKIALEALNKGFAQGFIAALALVVLVMLVGCLVWVVLRNRRRCRGFTIPGENGDLYVTVNALREFVTRILCEYRQTSLRNVTLRKSRGGLALTIDADALPQTDLVALQRDVSKRVLAEASSKIGTEALLTQVNVTIHSYCAKESKIAKQSRRMAIPEGAAEEPEPESEEAVDYSEARNC